MPIKPLTLIFGANSSGKSSLIHSLLLANHALANGNVDVHQPRLAGQSVDLGGFNEFVHRHEDQRGCTLALTLHHKPHRPVAWFAEFNRTTLIFEIGKTIHSESSKEQSGSVGVSSFALQIDDCDFLRAVRRKNEKLRVISINFEHPFFKPFFAKINQLRPPESEFLQPLGPPQTNDSFGYTMEVVNRAGSPDGPKLYAFLEEQREAAQVLRETDEKVRADFPGTLRSKLENSMKETPLKQRNLVPVAECSSDPERRVYEDDPTKYWRELEEAGNQGFIEGVAQVFCFEMEDLLVWINEKFSRCLESLTYLGPLRCYPPRHLVGMHDEDPNWFSGGAHAWKRLLDEPSVREKVNHRLALLQDQSAGYEIRVRHLKDLGRVSEADRKRLADRLQQVGASGQVTPLATVEALLADLAGGQTGTAFDEVVLFDKRTGTEVSHRDVGVGISQILPVLVHAYADQNQIVAIEQPESQLHPALQAELGDVFIESALGERKNTFILETHSEHLILRILRRVRETTDGTVDAGATPVKPEDVSVVFVEPTPEGSKLRHLPVTPDGDFAVPWPGGFFADRFKDLP